VTKQQKEEYGKVEKLEIATRVKIFEYFKEKGYEGFRNDLCGSDCCFLNEDGSIREEKDLLHCDIVYEKGCFPYKLVKCTDKYDENNDECKDCDCYDDGSDDNEFKGIRCDELGTISLQEVFSNDLLFYRKKMHEFWEKYDEIEL
jgi:hypothetical protein